jgi:hypothetical protein
MCHEWRIRRDRWRDERFDEELRYLLDERERPEPATPVVREPEEEPSDPRPLRAEAGAPN